MELKNYQQHILNELSRFLSVLSSKGNIKTAYNDFWVSGNPSITPFPKSAVEPYKDNVPGAPHLCIKVPTGGGKTFIASAALKVIFDASGKEAFRTVVWLVPSNAILEQTLKNLKDKFHHYRQRIDTDFQNRVEVYSKEEALNGQGFTIQTAREKLSIIVASFDSFRTKNKDGRKVYQENGFLQSFEPLTKPGETTLNNVLRALQPVVIVDESHNATSKLSEDMIKVLNPSFVLDLTATPRQNSNVICFTDALELKKNNMVKLPVIVYNLDRKEQVIDSAISLRKHLEQTAQQYTDRYIRPIVLFQAESKSGTAERETFDKIKQNLIESGIPENQIAIKTAEINEIKDINLIRKGESEIRYIITVNALKEGWDCPFAYILATLADRTSKVDVEQIVGRVLRQPYTLKNPDSVLNMSYVLTSSAKFQDTLQSVVEGLNQAGFSERDVRSSEETPTMPPQLFEPKKPYVPQLEITITESKPTSAPAPHFNIEKIIEVGEKAEQEMEQRIQEQTDNNTIATTKELENMVKKVNIQSVYASIAAGIKIPQFHIESINPQISILETEPIKLEDTHLLKGFKLLDQEKPTIDFSTAETNLYRVDIDEHTDEHKLNFFKVSDIQAEYLINRMQSDKESLENKKRLLASVVVNKIGKMPPSSEKDVRLYTERILEPLRDDELEFFANNLNGCIAKIKEKIRESENKYKKEQFDKWFKQNKLNVIPSYLFPKSLSLREKGKNIPKALYGTEESINGFEEEVINAVANLDNIMFWTRNLEKRDFYINGFIRHYPDFIIYTKKGVLILLETKGDHLDAADKIALGKYWQDKCGMDKYRYFMVYNTRQVKGAETKDQFLETLKEL